MDKKEKEFYKGQSEIWKIIANMKGKEAFRKLSELEARKLPIKSEIHMDPKDRIIDSLARTLEKMQERIDSKDWEYERNLVINSCNATREKIKHAVENLDDHLIVQHMDNLIGDIKALR